jgi:hypothetical protein
MGMKRILISLAMLAGAFEGLPAAAGPLSARVGPIGAVSIGDKLAVLKTAGINLPSLPPPDFTLTVAKPSTDYGFLYFLLPAEIVTEPKLYGAVLSDDPHFQSIAEVHWQALPSTTYLVDCDIQAKSGIVTVDGVPGMKLTDGHLIVARKSSSNASYASSSTFIQIQPSSHASAVFKGCEITKVSQK